MQVMHYIPWNCKANQSLHQSDRITNDCSLSIANHSLLIAHLTLLPIPSRCLPIRFQTCPTGARFEIWCRDIAQQISDMCSTYCIWCLLAISLSLFYKFYCKISEVWTSHAWLTVQTSSCLLFLTGCDCFMTQQIDLSAYMLYRLVRLQYSYSERREHLLA